MYGVRERVAREIDEHWQADLIKAWNTADWIDLPARVGDRIGRLIGAPGVDETAGLRGTRVSFVPQDPFRSFDPLRRVGPQVRRPLQLHRGRTAAEADAQVADLLARLGVGEFAAGLGLGAVPVLGAALVQDGTLGPAAWAAALPAFAMVRDWVLGIGGGPLVSLAVASEALGASCAADLADYPLLVGSGVTVANLAAYALFFDLPRTQVVRQTVILGTLCGLVLLVLAWRTATMLRPVAQLLAELRRFTMRDDFADDLTLVAVSPRRE